MAITKNFSGIEVELTDEGYLVNPNKWTLEIAKAIAKEENLELTEKHVAVLNYLREKFQKKEPLQFAPLTGLE